jgi:hypothetical protein
LEVENASDYEAVCSEFARETEREQILSRLEVGKALGGARYYIHDRFSMLIVRVSDDAGDPIPDSIVQLIGPGDDRNSLEHSLVDRLRNPSERNCFVFYLNYDVLVGSPAIEHPQRGIIRERIPGPRSIGINVCTENEGHVVAQLSSSPDNLRFVQPNETTLIEIVLDRVIPERLVTLTADRSPHSFKDTEL